MPLMFVFQIQCKTVHVIVMAMASVFLVSATVFLDFMEQIVLKVSFPMFTNKHSVSLRYMDLRCLLVSMNLSQIQVNQYAFFSLVPVVKYDQMEVLPHCCCTCLTAASFSLKQYAEMAVNFLLSV